MVSHHSSFPTGGWCSWKRRRRITRDGDPVHCPLNALLSTRPGRTCLPSIRPRPKQILTDRECQTKRFGN
uniref:Uncharacterized protein n=1 Tax=Setaria italica TaxID=4555 RepID=K4AHN2_SETIT